MYFAAALTLKSPPSVTQDEDGHFEKSPDSKPSAKMRFVGGVGSKLAVMEVSAARVTVQVLVPEQPPPLQPVNVEPEAAVAVRVTTVLVVKA
jgi:hypothetical protein